MSHPHLFADDTPDAMGSPKSKLTTVVEWIANLILLLLLIALCTFLIQQIIALWPGGKSTKWGLFDIEISEDQRFFILVALGGALGAFVHAATSFTDFIGNKKIVYSWVPWYIARPFIGSALATIFYLLIRGGLVSVSTVNGEGGAEIPLNPFGIMAIACLAGLFSKQAIDKLKEVFENLFQIKNEVHRADPLDTAGENTRLEDDTNDDNPKG